MNCGAALPVALEDDEEVGVVWLPLPEVMVPEPPRRVVYVVLLPLRLPLEYVLVTVVSEPLPVIDELDEVKFARTSLISAQAMRVLSEVWITTLRLPI